MTYATAVAAAVPDLGVALGALSTYARPTALTAMTVSALDDLAPGRITVALGSALPLRLAQMQIPYDPGVAIEAVRTQLHDLRALWRGERLARTGLPDLEPMFPPVHRVPLWVAGYRKAFHELAGEAADGYLARPAESIPAIRIAKDRIAAAARAAGRDPDEIEIGGYLLSLVDSSRRAALDRAKREPFVDLHARRAVGHRDAPGRARPRAQGPGVRGLAGGRLPPRGRADPGRAGRRVHPLRHAGRGRRARGGVRRRGHDGAGAAAGAAGGGPGRLRPRRRGHVRVGSGRRGRRAAVDRGPVPGGGLGRPAAAQPGRDHPAVRADRLDRAGRARPARWRCSTG